MDNFEEMMKRLRYEAQAPSVDKSGLWRRYDDIVSQLSSEQRQWVCKQENVLTAKSQMYSLFLDYIFENNKDAFISVSDGKYKKICEEYVDSLQAAASSYVSRAELLEKQNADLVAQNKKLQDTMDRILKEGKYEQMAAIGSGRSRKGDTSVSVRSGNDSRQDGYTPDLFEDQPEQTDSEV